MLLACVSVLSISRCERNMLRSPFSMYSVTMHSGSDDTHTHSSRMMLGSFRRDMIFISFRKSFLTDRQDGWREGRGHIIRFGQALSLEILCFRLTCFYHTNGQKVDIIFSLLGNCQINRGSSSPLYHHCSKQIDLKMKKMLWVAVWWL